MKKLIAITGLVTLFLLNFCFNSLFIHFGMQYHTAFVDRECCDFTAQHHENLNAGAIFLTFTMPTLILMFVLVLAVNFAVRPFVSQYSPYFYRKFSKGILQLE